MGASTAVPLREESTVSSRLGSSSRVRAAKPGLLGRLLGRHRVRQAPGEELQAAEAKSRVLYVNDVRRTQEYADHLHRELGAERYHSNVVRTSKYSLLNFIPKSLFEQFRRVANFYFLIISLLQLFTDLSPTNEYSTIGPLTIVLFATMVKEGMEDRARHRQDHIVNHQKVQVLGATPDGHAPPGSAKVHDAAAAGGSRNNLTAPSFQPIFWKNLRVGHVVKLHDKDQVPADIVLLFSSHEDAEAMCETSSLDGESNLKVRHCIKWGQLHPRAVQDFGAGVQGEIRCELPNKRLYSFDGVLRLSFMTEQAKREMAGGRPLPDAEEIPISIENVMLRGMKLCNTKWVIGVVVGAGNDSKLVQNMKAIPSKFSRLDRIANRCIFLIFSVLFAVCCISSVQSALFSNKVHSRLDFAKALPFIDKFSPGQYLEAWITYLILYNNMVPISLYISLEVVKWYQARRIENDPRLRCKDSGLGVTARTSNVNEDLGQIKYIFSDKTGTLTRNQMLFKVCSIGGIIYDGSSMELRRLANADSTELASAIPSFTKASSNMAKNNPEGTGSSSGALLNAAIEFDCVFEDRIGDLIQIRLFGERETFRLLALNEFDSVRKCMSVVVQQVRDDKAAQNSGYRSSHTDDNKEAAADGEADEVLVFCKGADTVMFSNAANAQDISKLGLHVHYFAAMALRTLLFGMRRLSMAEFLTWKQEYDSAKKTLVGREQICLDVARKIETSISLLGATGVEDLLQDGVRECIDQLVQAGVNVWMLTGDKDETAISVAHMCGLIGEKSKIIIIKGKTKQDCLDEIANARRKLKREGVWVPGVASRSMSLVINGEALELLLADSSPSPPQTSGVPVPKLGAAAALPIGGDEASARTLPSAIERLRAAQQLDGFGEDATTNATAAIQDSLSVKSASGVHGAANGAAIQTTATAVQPPITHSRSSNPRVASRHTSTRPSIADSTASQQQAHELFMELATQCSSVVACRLSPMQKAQVVGLMKSARGAPLTLAVGDGGNDVSMIQEAHVGVGIYGHEGMQAVRAADFAIATFQHLSRLLLVHGRWNHRRVALVILYSFYKNMALIMTLFIYSQRNAYSGQTLYESYLMVGWNVAYTLLPIFVLGIADEDIRDRAVLRYPFVYRTSLRHSELSIQKLSIWVTNALMHSILVFFFTMRTLENVASLEGRPNGLFVDGTAVYGALVITVNLKAAMVMQPVHRWTRAHYASLLGGFGAFLIFVAAYSQAYHLFPTFDVFGDFSGIATILFGEAKYWMLLLFSSVASLVPDFAISYIRHMYVPSSDNIIQEIDAGLVDEMDGDAASTLASQALNGSFHGQSPGVASSAVSASSASAKPSPPGAIRASKIVQDPLPSTRSDGANTAPGDNFAVVPAAFPVPSALGMTSMTTTTFLSTPTSGGVVSHTQPAAGRSDLTSSLLDGEWSQKFRDFDRPTEHDELSKQLISLQREIALEIGLTDPLLSEEDAQSTRALTVQPSVHPLTLEFMGEQHQQLEHEYELTFAFRERVRVLLCLRILAVVIPVYALYEIFVERETGYYRLRIGFLVCDLLYMRVVRTRFFLEHYEAAILVPFCAIGMALTITISDTGVFAAALYPVVLFVVIRVKFLYALMLSVYNIAFYLLAGELGLKLTQASDVAIQDLVLFGFYMVFVIAFGAFSCYSLQITMRRDFLQSRSLLLEQRRSTQILKNMLPEHVVQRMQKGETLISEDEKDVTILFCDIADFASFVTRFSPVEVVTLLDRVYSLFDQMCQKHGVRKMETVGKTYMACAGLQGKDRGREAALRAVSMAIDMLTTLDRCRASNGNGVKLRIGIHSGRVISGLVGMKKQQFSLFGDTVNTASRMQSTGITGRCQVSHVTYKKLVGHFRFEERQIQVKGKGSMTTYMLGEPLTELARMAVAGQLEHIVKRDSIVVSELAGFAVSALGSTAAGALRAFDPDFLLATRQKLMQNARKRWARYDIVRLLFGSPPMSLEDLGTPNPNLGAISGVEQDMLTEIHYAQLRFKEDEMEHKYLESTLSDRVEGARTTLTVVAFYALFAVLRDITYELLRTRVVTHPVLVEGIPPAIVGKRYETSSETIAIIMVSRLVYGTIAAMMARQARNILPEYNKNQLRNVLLSIYVIGLVAFTLPQGLLWRRCYLRFLSTSTSYVHLCLDTVLAMFLVSNGGSILHRQAVVFNIIALGIVTTVTVICLSLYLEEVKSNKNTDEYRLELAELEKKVYGYNEKFQTMYPIVLTYLSVIANIYAAFSVEFFTRRQIWLKTRTQLETMNADRLLYQMLPAAVVMRLKEGETVCDQHQQVGILFSDIKGFTTIASQANPAQVVNILASLFCAFDKLTEKHGVFKMQTIGDAYVIVSGLPYVDMSLGPVMGAPGASVATASSGAPSIRSASSRVIPMSVDLTAMTSERQGQLARRSTLKHKFQMHIRSHIRDLLAMARDMHKEVRKVNDPNTGEPLQMRIGIHIGNIIGGVIGTTTLRYDMWGPDALTANELESNSLPEQTLVSPVVMEVVKGMPDIKCTFYKKINFTNVSMMDTYLVEFVEPAEAGASPPGHGSVISDTTAASSSGDPNGQPSNRLTAPRPSNGSTGLKALLAQGSTRTLQLLTSAASNPRSLSAMMGAFATREEHHVGIKMAAFGLAMLQDMLVTTFLLVLISCVDRFLGPLRRAPTSPHSLRAKAAQGLRFTTRLLLHLAFVGLTLTPFTVDQLMLRLRGMRFTFAFMNIIRISMHRATS
ncbi:hypothetical protein ATCC90586_003017 [Pythium insidiosum]|nr:hypothetical protein ATCC90586_003017 [Pythium insidiosum]